MNDQALITRVIVNDDHHAFATLVRKYQRPIRLFLRRLTAGDHALADDLAQDVFIASYNKLSSYRAEATFNTWLHSIAYRLFLNEKRKPHYQRETELVTTLHTLSTLDTTENELLIERLMQKLSIPERTCMTLAYSAGMSHQEVVDVVQLPLGTVKSHINRAKQKLTQWLKKD
ncbi:RNA polymerase sigma factor [Idiomarina xiamenensis]|uniref:RNA polymerase sigma factor n=1 Tax=Idiomarina xiamenensis 10-D-4 TaxID=740709 RepID=K2KMP6_9GAMM|nr:sigma-70 family RNA polymerase sigma factor [Idiomarina xiamenensis]EKE83714.1 sigma-24 FecI-like protein [Idiomarina xiamenensis 10-D-4]